MSTELQPTGLEQDVFLKKAASAMEKYRKRHGTYPSDWWQMDFHFDFEPYHETDAGIFPELENGSQWQPKNCKFSYLIAQANRVAFRIEARDQAGVALFWIAQGMESPKAAA